jgi:hypothetical protein
MIRIIFITSFLFFYNKLNSQSILDIKDAVSTYIVNYKNAIYTNDNSIIHIKPDIKIKKSYILYSKIHKNINSYNIKKAIPCTSFLVGITILKGFFNRPIYNWEKILEVIQKYTKKSPKKIKLSIQTINVYKCYLKVNILK